MGTFGFTLPLLKGGSVKPPPVTVAQMRELWENGDKTKQICKCNLCKQEYRYLPGEGLRRVEELDTE